MNVNELHQLAQDAYRAGNPQKSASLYGEILTMSPDNLPALFMLGLLSAQAGNYPGAIGYFKRVVGINPYHIDAHYNLGNVYRDSGNLREAFSCYQKVLQLNPLHAEAYVNIGIIFRFMGRPKEELASYQKAIQIKPDSAEAFFNLGHYFFEREDFDQALAWYEKAIQVDPHSDRACMNIALIVRIQGRHKDAIPYYRRAIEYNPDNAVAHWNLSNVLLLLGDFEAGWEEYLWLWKTEDAGEHRRNFPGPSWQGEDITGLTILLYSEHGFGDTVQFVRYAPLVACRGAKVILDCQPELVPLLKTVEGLQTVIPAGSKLPPYDLHCSLMKLPILFHTAAKNIPSAVPYIKADPVLIRKWADRLRNRRSKVTIGLTWAGSSTPKKYCPLNDFSPLLQLDGVVFYSLQKGRSADQAKNLPDRIQLLDYTDDLHDFSDTAALIENLDLVISIDTSVAHVTGALGKPVWVLLPFVPDWRWMLGREDSPWYPTMSLFRQPALGDWGSVISLIVEQLKRLLRGEAEA
ncbi:MAG: tetratricopeptide repeat protein [Nitrospirota bacterium]